MTDEERKNELVFNQYELMVNSTLQVTAWRQTANGFYITLNTAILALLSGIFENVNIAYPLLGIAGIAISICWYKHIEYFSKLNGAKFEMIAKMEEQLPVKAFVGEHECFKSKKCRNATQIEKGIVWVFIILYCAVLVSAVIQVL